MDRPGNPPLPNRRRLVLLGLALSVLCAVSAVVSAGRLPGQPSAASGHDWPSFGFDVSRSNASTAPTDIDASKVSSIRLQQVRLDGTVDSSAIYLRQVPVGGKPHDVFFVTTTYGKTLAVDANDGAILWRYTPPGYESWAGSRQITTATPVADPDRTAVYAASPDGRVHKLSVNDGRALWSAAITRLPEREKIASALNYFRGRVIAVTGGYIGDAPPYQGHVAILDAASGRLLHVWNSLCSDRQGLLDPHACRESGSAIWGRSGAVVDPSTGNLFVATGNGRWDGRTFWGDSVLELDPDATRIEANYTPANTEQLSARDQDLGSTSPVLLASGLLAQGGKDARIRLLELARLRGTTPHRGGESQSVETPSGQDLFTAPAVRRSGDLTWLYAADNGGTAAWLVRGGRLEPKWKNARAGTSPVIAGGLLYVYDPTGGLRVYEPDTGRQLTSLQCGEGHWNSPIVVDGKIALPEGNANSHRTNGVLDIWRLPR